MMFSIRQPLILYCLIRVGINTHTLNIIVMIDDNHSVRSHMHIELTAPKAMILRRMK